MVSLTGKEQLLVERVQREFKELGPDAISLMRRLVTDELGMLHSKGAPMCGFFFINE